MDLPRRLSEAEHTVEHLKEQLKAKEAALDDLVQDSLGDLKAFRDVVEERNNLRVEEDRSITIQAAIVRIMKTRKTLNHANLVAELISQLSFFKPTPKAIKHQIEQLIEREYLARDEQQPNVYNYLA